MSWPAISPASRVELGRGLRLGEVGDSRRAFWLSRLSHDERQAVAAFISRSAAARASSVISAPASMRAISSRRRAAASTSTSVATRSPVERVLGISQMLVGTRGDLRRVGDHQHLHLAARRASAQPMASATAPPTPVSISSNTSVGRRAAVGQHHLQRQREAGQLAARGDLHQRTGPRAGIGAHPELDAVDAVRPGRGRIALDCDAEAGRVELQRRQLGVDGLVEPVGGGAAPKSVCAAAT